jgi:trimeric autotransporter adhesin
MAGRVIVLACLAACGFPRPADVPDPAVQIGGTVHGLWTGADGVALRLTATGVDTLYTVPVNGDFVFPTTLAEGASYVASIASNPARHSCTIVAGANGVVPAGSVTAIDVACVGPDVKIGVSAPQPWTFDPTRDTQGSVDGSWLLQSMSVTVDSADPQVHAVVAGAPVTLGRPSAPFVIAADTSMVNVDITAPGGLSKTYQIPISRGGHVLEQAAYAKPSDTKPNFNYGYSIAISGDTMVVGAGNALSGAGAAYVYRRRGTAWTPEATLHPSNARTGSRFGMAVAIDGDLIAVSAPLESSNATLVDGNQLDTSTPGAGAVYVFQRTGTSWAQQSYVKAPATPSHDFGVSLALSADTLVAGADSDIAVHVYSRSGTTWTFQATLKGMNPAPTSPDDAFGKALALSGTVIAVGAPFFNNYAGAVYVFRRAGATWLQEAYLRQAVPDVNDDFGSSVSIQGDTLAVGAAGEGSSSTGIGGDQTSNAAANSGAVYLFGRSNSVWAQQVFIKASNTQASDGFGVSVALTSDLLAVGAAYEASGSRGIAGNQQDNSMSQAGAAYLFRRDGPTWQQEVYVKASNTHAGDQFGAAVVLSGDTFAIGAPYEPSGAIGIGGDQSDTGALRAGAVYVFR